MATLERSPRIADRRRAWPLALLFAIVNWALIFGVAALERSNRQEGLLWLSTFVDALVVSVPVFLLAQPAVGAFLQHRGRWHLGRALVLSLPWTVLVYAIGAVGLLVAVFVRNGGALFP